MGYVAVLVDYSVVLDVVPQPDKYYKIILNCAFINPFDKRIYFNQHMKKLFRFPSGINQEQEVEYELWYRKSGTT